MSCTPLSENHDHKDRLILFTRYPEAARVKTRLIPALGAEGACALHRQLVEQTVKQVDRLNALQPLSFEVRYTGGSPALMRKWLGPARELFPQGRGRLGLRMKRAFQQAFQAGFNRVILIGSDIPGLTPAILKKAFSALSFHDLVLGPARDGGYYLIGMTRPLPLLFQGIPWGTAFVFEATAGIARQSGLTPFLLEPLNDIDRPEDLLLCNDFKS
jgi:rSAM/selenodomain-associated transferase 1